MKPILRRSVIGLVVAWFLFVIATGFCVNEGGSIIAGFVAALCIICLGSFLRGWGHFFAIPLYLYFTLEVLALALLLSRMGGK